MIVMKKVFLSLLFIIYSSALLLAQETKQVDVNVNTEGGAWYASPWVWIVGVAVFILLLVALTRGGRRAD